MQPIDLFFFSFPRAYIKTKKKNEKLNWHLKIKVISLREKQLFLKFLIEKF